VPTIKNWIADGVLVPKRTTAPPTVTPTDIRTMLRTDGRAPKPRVSARHRAAYTASTKAGVLPRTKAAARKPVKRARAA
jgi:hypothetical protein